MHTNSGTSRRAFLTTGAAALAGLTLSRYLSADVVAGEEAYGGLRMGVQSYTFRDRSFEKAVEALHDDLKLACIEIYPNHITGIGPSKAKELAAAHDVTPVGYGVVPFSKDNDANRKTFELARTLGVKYISCDPDPGAFDSLDKLTEEYGITADIHDHGPGHRWGKIDTIWAAIKDHSNGVGLCNDTGHFIRAGEDPMRACELFKDRMHAMHLKDFKKKDKGWEDCVLGDGSLQVAAIVKWLLANKFKGGLSLEYEGRDPVKVSLESLERVRKAVAEARKA